MSIKSALIITYYWPPDGGGGVQRWLLLSKYLQACGVRVVIYTPDKNNSERLDPSLGKHINSDIEVWKHPIFDPYLFLFNQTPKRMKRQGYAPSRMSAWWEHWLVWLRIELFVPDLKVLFMRASIKYLFKRLQKEPVDVIISTGPPHSMHLIGMQLKKLLGVPWVADFRDPWTRWEVLLNLRPSSRVLRKHLRLERQVLQQCSLLTTISQAWCDDFKKQGASLAYQLPNGYEYEPAPTPPPSGAPFVLVHMGNLSLDRAASFVQVLKKHIAQQSPWIQNLIWKVGGEIDAQLENYLNKHLPNHFQYVGYVPHQALLDYFSQAHLLLVFSNISPAMKGQIPGKLFEYLPLHRQVLMMGSQHSSATSLIAKTGLGTCVDWDDPTAIAQALENAYNTRHQAIQPKNIAPYSRKNQAQAFYERLKRLVGDS